VKIIFNAIIIHTAIIVNIRFIVLFYDIADNISWVTYDIDHKIDSCTTKFAQMYDDESLICPANAKNTSTNHTAKNGNGIIFPDLTASTNTPFDYVELTHNFLFAFYL